MKWLATGVISLSVVVFNAALGEPVLSYYDMVVLVGIIRLLMEVE